MKALTAHRHLLAVAIASGTLLLGACAYTLPEVDPADIPRLEEELQLHPADVELRVQLGMARYKAEDFEAARTLLRTAVDSGSQSGVAHLYLGMAEEEFENWSAARAAYNTYLDVGRSQPLKDEVRRRLQLIGQRVLQQQARAALAQEEDLDAQAVTPRSVAVLPFGFNSDREELQPLVYALSDMMITDFAVSNALTVLERTQIQTLLDEMALTEAGYAEAETGARAGRLLGAESVVQGVITTLGQEDIRVDSEVLNIPTSASAGTVEGEDALNNLFDLEKQIVFETLRDVLGVELTPAEEQAILDNRAQNVLAFLAYGRGLRERDRGNYQGALQAFRQAQQLDPSFDAATSAAEETTQLEDAAATTPADLQQTATNTGETVGGSPAPGAGSSTQGALRNAGEGVNPTPTAEMLGAPLATGGGGTPEGQRDPVQEAQGQEGTTSGTAEIRIIIRAPGGGS